MPKQLKQILQMWPITAQISFNLTHWLTSIWGTFRDCSVLDDLADTLASVL